MYKGEKNGGINRCMSMIKKTCNLLYHVTGSFEQILWNVTHLMRVTFTFSKAV